MGMLVAFLRRAIRARVVLVAIDVAAHSVLLVIHLIAFLLRQVTAVGCAVLAHFAIDTGFLIFQVTGFARRQLARADALSDASLLVAFTLVDAAICCVRGTAMIFGREVCVVQAGAVFVRDLKRRTLD